MKKGGDIDLEYELRAELIYIIHEHIRFAL